MNPQFLLNKRGEKTAVLLTIEEYHEMLEDLSDLTAVVNRRNSPHVSLEQIKRDFIDDGIIYPGVHKASKERVKRSGQKKQTCCC